MIPPRRCLIAPSARVTRPDIQTHHPLAVARVRRDFAARHRDVPRFFTIGNHTFHCWNHSGHGRVDAETAIKESCDVFFYERGLKTGLDTITKVAAEFGLGQPTGFDIGSEGRGLVPSAAWKRTQRGEKWWDGDTVQLSIGQSFLLVTPMQMACVAATFANRGTCLRPYVVKRIESSDGQVVHEGEPDVRTHLSAKPQQIEFVRHAMLGAVQDGGTAHPAAVAGLAVAGKTGTAQYDKTVDGKAQRFDRAWFIGFTPFDSTAGCHLGFDRRRERRQPYSRRGRQQGVCADVWQERGGNASRGADLC